MAFANQISCCDGGIHDGTENEANTLGLSLLENASWYSENGEKGEPCSRPFKYKLLALKARLRVMR